MHPAAPVRGAACRLVPGASLAAELLPRHALAALLRAEAGTAVAVLGNSQRAHTA